MSNDDSKPSSPSSTQRGFPLKLDTSSPPRPQLRRQNDSSSSSSKRSFLSESLRRQEHPTPSIDSVAHNHNFDHLHEMLQTHVSIPSSASCSTPPPPREGPELDFNITPEAAMSPTLGLSEAEWRAIPFSTRRKLKVAVQQQYSQANSPTEDKSTSLPSSVATKHPSRPIPFSQRQRDRSATMYPINTRSVSQMSTDSSSPSNSPAFQFLSRLGTTTEAAASNHNNSSTNFGDELGEQVGDYIIGKLIGYGGFSQVKEAHAMERGKKVIRAVKIVVKYNPASTPEYMERVQSEFDHEVTIWKTLDHEYILRLLSVEENAKAIYCFTEKITGGTLFDLVKNNRGTLSEPLIKQYAYQLASALLYLHDTMRIVHRDVKLENCLLEEMSDGTTKLLLCDFGMSDYYEPNDDASTTKSTDDTNEKDKNGKSRHNGNSLNVIGPSDTSSLFNQYHSHTPDGANSEGSSYFGSRHGSSNATPDVNPDDPMMTPPPHDPLRVQHSRAHHYHLTKHGQPQEQTLPQEHTLPHEHTLPQEHNPTKHDNEGNGRGNGGTKNSKRGGGGGGGNPVPQSGVQVRDWHAPAVEKLGSGCTTQNFGSLPYACPQLLTSSVPIIDPSVDMWSYGVVIHALFMGHLPWNHAFLPKLRMMILQGDWDKTSLQRRGGQLARQVCERCLDMDWETRAQIREIVEHRWLREERRLYGPSGRMNREEDRVWAQSDVD